MRREKFIIIFLAIALFGGCKKENQFKSESPYGQFAPKDAYSENPNLAYYGAENEWTRRMFSQKAADRFYKRRGQRQMLAILDGHPEQAMELCEKRLAADPNDQESLFVLAVALTQLQKLNEAMDAVQLAVDAGLPFARFVAGPRDLLKPLTETTMFRQYAERHPLRLVHGPLLGCMTDHSVRFWMRTTGEDQVKVRAWEKDNPGNVLESGTERSSAQQDYVVIAKVEGLVAKRKYVYNVWVNGQSVFETALPTFTTFPAPGIHHNTSASGMSLAINAPMPCCCWVTMSISICRKCPGRSISTPITADSRVLNFVTSCSQRRFTPFGMIMMRPLTTSGWDPTKISLLGKCLC